MAVSYYDTRMIANYVSSQIVFCLVCWPCAPIPLCMDSLKVLPQYHQYCWFHLQYHHHHHGFPTNYHQSYSNPPGEDDISDLIMIKYGNVTVSLTMMMWIYKTESKSSTRHVFKYPCDTIILLDRRILWTCEKERKTMSPWWPYLKTQDVMHRCPSCHCIVGRSSTINSESLKKETRVKHRISLNRTTDPCMYC